MTGNMHFKAAVAYTGAFFQDMCATWLKDGHGLGMRRKEAEEGKGRMPRLISLSILLLCPHISHLSLYACNLLSGAMPSRGCEFFSIVSLSVLLCRVWSIVCWFSLSPYYLGTGQNSGTAGILLVTDTPNPPTCPYTFPLYRALFAHYYLPLLPPFLPSAMPACPLPHAVVYICTRLPTYHHPVLLLPPTCSDIVFGTFPTCPYSRRGSLDRLVVPKAPLWFMLVPSLHFGSFSFSPTYYKVLLHKWHENMPVPHVFVLGREQPPDMTFPSPTPSHQTP